MVPVTAVKASEAAHIRIVRRARFMVRNGGGVSADAPEPESGLLRVGGSNEAGGQHTTLVCRRGFRMNQTARSDGPTFATPEEEIEHYEERLAAARARDRRSHDA